MNYLLGSFKPTSRMGPGIGLFFLLIIFCSVLPAEAQPTRALRVVDTNIERGKSGQVAIDFDALGDENTIGFSLNFDPAKLSFISAAVGNGAPTGTLFTNENQKLQGRIGLAVGLPSGGALAAGKRQIVVVTFTAATTGNSASIISFGDNPIPREYVTPNATTIPVDSVALNQGMITIYSLAVNASAASYSTNAISPQSIVAVFGVDLATSTLVASTIPLPTNLLGTTIKVKDGAGAERPSQLFFVSPGQCNYELPAGTALGTATVTIISGDGRISIGTVTVAALAPAIFTANSSGQGVAAAEVYRVRGNVVTIEQAARFDAPAGIFVPNPIDLGPPEEQIILVLYGTGIRFNSGLSNVTTTVGGTNVPVAYANLVAAFVGLDQVNLGPIPRSLIGRGVVNIALTVDNTVANAVTIAIK